MEYTKALRIIGGLSKPSKMPWFSWSLSAFDCHTGGKLQGIEGSVCHGCYAMKGNYRFPNVRLAHDRRLKAIDDPDFVQAFVTVLTLLYDKTKSSYTLNSKYIKENRFRWMDSGDIQSLDHLKKINAIAMATPFIRHWLPTKEYGILKEFFLTEVQAPNLVIRASHAMVGGVFKTRPPDRNFSTVGAKSETFQCPAYKQSGKCSNCSQCWDQSIPSVNYPKH